MRHRSSAFAGTRRTLPQRALAAMASILLASGSIPLVSGCIHSTTYPKSQVVMVKTKPAGAQIFRTDGQKRTDFGPSPAPVHLTYEIEQVRLNRWVLWGITGGMGVMMIGGAGWAANVEKEQRGVPMLLSIVGVMGFVLGTVRGITTELKKGSSTLPSTASLWASAPGYQDTSAEVQIPLDHPELIITLAPRELEPAEETEELAPATQPAAGRPIVAVFEVKDERGRLTPAVLNDLTELFATQLASGGRYSVVPRAQLRRRLEQRDPTGAGGCASEACQLELGRALAAEKIVDTRVLSVGTRCRVTAVLYDLNTETTDHAAAVLGPCTAEGLAEAMAKLARLTACAEQPRR